MQTFLPDITYSLSAAKLDNKRLGKQRVEAKQILMCLRGEGCLGWKNHPAVKMWKGYEYALAHYGLYICAAWRSKGFKDTLYDYFDKCIKDCNKEDVFILMHPPWLTEEFSLAHRSNLVRKDPTFYRPLFPNVPDNLPYIWPVK